MKVANKVMVVTGGGNGIGREVVLELLGRGAQVAAVDLREQSLVETHALAAASRQLTTFPVDVTDRVAIAALPDQIRERLGEPDGLVNVAGIIQPFVPVAELDDAVIERVVDVNFFGTLHVVRAFLPGLLQRPVAHIANVSSMGGYLPVPGQTIYGASKAAVRLLTEGLYAELRDTRVGVSVVFPGAVGTDITGNSGVAVPAMAASEDVGRFPTTSPEDAAQAIVAGIEANRLYIFVGRDARLMNLLGRVAPRRSTHLIQRQMKRLLD